MKNTFGARQVVLEFTVRAVGGDVRQKAGNLLCSKLCFDIKFKFHFKIFTPGEAVCSHAINAQPGV